MEKYESIFCGLLLLLMAFAIGVFIYVVIKSLKELYGTDEKKKGA